MLDPRNNMRFYLTWTFILIIFLLITKIAIANENGDLSGEKYPIIVVSDGFGSSTVDKVGDVLDKIDKLENDKGVYYDKIVTIPPKKVDGQYCFVKIIIKQKGDTIVKEEVLECSDGRKKFDGPGYWDLFAMFYYKDIYTPEYCRKYSRSNHAFKSYGTVCLDKNGEWEVK
tara:strand:- start:229 stop:741 length:513 start_codon:yes stop_codon:yes gene_type:complete